MLSLACRNKPIVMVDKEDLYVNTIADGVSIYEACIDKLENMNNIHLLRLVGVVFDELSSGDCR